MSLLGTGIRKVLFGLISLALGYGIFYLTVYILVVRIIGDEFAIILLFLPIVIFSLFCSYQFYKLFLRLFGMQSPTPQINENIISVKKNHRWILYAVLVIAIAYYLLYFFGA